MHHSHKIECKIIELFKNQKDFPYIPSIALQCPLHLGQPQQVKANEKTAEEIIPRKYESHPLIRSLSRVCYTWDNPVGQGQLEDGEDMNQIFVYSLKL